MRRKMSELENPLSCWNVIDTKLRDGGHTDRLYDKNVLILDKLNIDYISVYDGALLQILVNGKDQERAIEALKS